MATVATGLARRAPAIAALVIVTACAPRPVTEAEIAAVYSAFGRGDLRLDSALVQAVTEPVAVAGFDDPLAEKGAFTRSFTGEVREALEDLDRQTAPVPLPNSLRVSPADRRIPSASMRALLDSMAAGRPERLPPGMAAVRLSAIGFSRDRSVAVLYRTAVFGKERGGAVLQVLRRHPSGWIVAERLFEVVV
jgi:hypothetical protein